MDTTTALLIAVITIFANGALLFTIRGHLTADTRSAARWWLGGSLAVASGCLAFLFSTALPDTISLVTPNSLIVGGLICYTVALRRFYHAPVPHLWLLAGLAATTVGVWYFHWQLPSLRTRVVIVSLAWTIVMAYSLGTLYLRRVSFASRAENMLAWLYGFMIAGTLVRMVLFLGFDAPPDFHVTDNSTWLNRLSPILAIILPTIGTTAFFLMCYLRQYHRVRQQALTDPLTGLGNRALLAALSSRIDDAPTAAPKFYGAVLLIDLDGFKAINDTYGHAAGDEVLVGVSDRLRSLARPQDILLRLGGDEFAIVVRGRLPLDRVYEMAQQALLRISGTYHTASADFILGASIGAAVAARQDGSLELDMLMEAADHAMYDAKRRGGGYQVATCAAPGMPPA